MIYLIISAIALVLLVSLLLTAKTIDHNEDDIRCDICKKYFPSNQINFIKKQFICNNCIKLLKHLDNDA